MRSATSNGNVSVLPSAVTQTVHFFSRIKARSGDPVISSTITPFDDSVAHSFECKQFDTAVSLCLKPLAYP